jgi:hypothetical protein
MDVDVRAAPPPRAPHHDIFDRSYIHGDPSAGGRRGIALQGASTSRSHPPMSTPASLPSVPARAEARVVFIVNNP